MKYLCRLCHKVNGTTKENQVITYKNKVYKYTRYSCNKCNINRAKSYRKTKRGKEVWRNIMRRQYIRHTNKIICRAKLNRAIKTGKIFKPIFCQLCKKETKSLDAHHNGYSKPLVVKWVCRQCHCKL